MEFGTGLVPAHSPSPRARGPRTPHSTNRRRTRSGHSGGVGPSPGTPAAASPFSRLASLASPGVRPRGPASPAVVRDASASRLDPRSSRIFRSLPIAGHYRLEKQIGEGTFSTVFLARSAEGKELALKHLVPTSKPQRIQTEVQCMRDAAGHSNVISLLGVWRVGGDVVLAMPYVEHCKFSDLVATAEVPVVQLYLTNLLSALEHIHRLGIIHRDVKPSNFLYDRRRSHFALVDFGLAQREEEAAGEAGQRGRKRSAEESGGEAAGSPAGSKRSRPAVLQPAAGGSLGSKRAVAILRQRGGEVEGVRRSPRKVFSPLTMTHDPGEEQEVVSPLASPAGQTVPRQRLGFPPTAEMGRPVVRCSPRKLNPALILGGREPPTPSPTLQRRESFTALLEPSLLSQATDQLKTPLLRASLTSHCSSALHPGRQGQASAPPARAPCSCTGTLRVCDSCLALPHLHANRAGTPGFRPPEVLLKSLRQTVAVDLWAVGVILLSFLSRSYPFFRAPDDMTALAEITAIFGTEAISAAARRYGRVLTVSQVLEPAELGPVCRELSARAEEPAARPNHLVTEEALDLARGLLQLDFNKRFSASRALRHPFIRNIQNGIN